MIELAYKCSCMQDEQQFFVRERNDDEDIVDYMETVVRPALGIHHTKVSPLCQSPTVEYLKLPISDDKPLGQTSKH